MYKSTRQLVHDLEKNGQVKRIETELDPELIIPAIHRRVVENGGPALLFEKVKGSPFPAVSNLFGTRERTFFIFRKELQRAKDLIATRVDPAYPFKKIWKAPGIARSVFNALPKPAFRSRPVFYQKTNLSQLPQIKSWPKDGGAFITLPQVYTEDPEKPGAMRSNIGMYRVQISGNQYSSEEAGMHYQIHRGIGVHHAKAIERGEKLRVSVFVGGPPSMTLSAVMPLPEGLPEIAFAGVMNGRSIRYARKDGFLFSSEADFIITGWIDPKKTKPEGPFGDHLGYYSLRHPFPYIEVESVYHRKGAIFPFTIVSRPPAEDSFFGEIIHEIAAPMIPVSVPGLKEVHAVDVAGVHPLLLAVGSERYVPYENRRPLELMTIANAVLGYNQMSLAKYLFIIAGEDNPELKATDVPGFFKHMLERIDFSRDLHFYTQAVLDTLDYTSGEMNTGSKLVITAAGNKRRKLTNKVPDLLKLPRGYQKAKIISDGILAISGKKFPGYPASEKEINSLSPYLSKITGIALVILSDDADFTAYSFDNFLWETFTRSNPSHDVHGTHGKLEYKHYSCEAPMIIDARTKPFHAPPLLEDKKTIETVEKLAASGGPLHGLY